MAPGCRQERVAKVDSDTCSSATHGVSTADQNPDHQIDALIRAGVDLEHIHLDRASGAKASRPKLDLVLQLLREGDTLKVTRLDLVMTA